MATPELNADQVFPRDAGYISRVRNAVISAIKDDNPRHRVTKKGNEAYCFVLTCDIGGDTWRTTFYLTRDGSRFDGMEDAEVTRAKALEKLQDIDPAILKEALKAQGK